MLLTECIWTPDSDGTFETACGNAFVFGDGGPRENGARFCPYCGRPLTAVDRVDAFTEDDHG